MHSLRRALLSFALLSVVVAIASASNPEMSCSYSSTCRYSHSCLGRYATAGRTVYFSRNVGCCTCNTPYACYGCTNFGECSLSSNTCRAIGLGPFSPGQQAALAGWVIAVVIIVPLVIIIGIITLISCCCCACCIGLRAGMRNHHEVEMVGTTVYVSQPAQVETMYYGAPRNDLHAAVPVQLAAPAAGPAYVAPPAYNMNAQVAAQPASQAQLYVPLTTPVDEDPFY